MSNWVIEMPEGFPSDDPCKWCPIECQINPNHCPVAHAKKAVEYKVEEIKIPEVAGYEVKMANPKMDGKPVKLWATEEE